MTKKWPLRALSRAVSRAYSSSSSESRSPFPLKHVTKSNFLSALSELKSHVRAADFVAIDLEMTGVTSAPWRESFEFDRSDVLYLKVKDSAEKFAVVQFGICPFRWDPQRLSFIAHPHNFFVFPHPELQGNGPSYGFLSQTTSINFLVTHDFDFNKCISEGVSYLSRAQETEALRRLSLQCEDESLDDTWRHSKEVRDMSLVSVRDTLFSERMKNRLREWQDGLLKERNGHGMLGDSKQQFQTIFYKKRPALCLNGFTSHERNLIQLVTRKHFKDLAYVHGSSENSCAEDLIVYTDCQHDKDLLMEEVKDEYHREAEMKIEAAIGFRHVIDLLSSENKLIVGHNCFLDIAHVHNKFLGPLPLTAEEFVSSVNKCFPYIIDTKVLLNQSSVLQQRMKKSSTGLSSAFSKLFLQQRMTKSSTAISSAFSKLFPNIEESTMESDLVIRPSVKVEVQVDDTRSSNWESGVKHEAGYDAFMTGCIFAQACSNLGINFKPNMPSENLANHEKLQKHTNLLYLSWTSKDIIDLRTGSKAEHFALNNSKRQIRKISFDNLVVIWGFPAKLTKLHIRKCISEVFGIMSVASVYRIDETAFLVEFSKAELVSAFMVLKESLERKNDAISILHPLSNLLEGGNTHVAGYETYVEICRTSISEVLFADQAEAIGIRRMTKLSEPTVEAKTQSTETIESVSAEICKEVVDDPSVIQKIREEVVDDPSVIEGIREALHSFQPEQLKQARASSL